MRLWMTMDLMTGLNSTVVTMRFNESRDVRNQWDVRLYVNQSLWNNRNIS